MTRDEFTKQVAFLAQSGDFKRAAEVGLAYAQNHGEDIKTIAEFCRSLLGLRHHALVKPIVNAALASNQDSEELHRLRVEMILVAKDAATAVEVCDDLILRFPSNVDFHSVRGVALRDLGRIEEAVASLREALRLNPNLPSAHFQLSTIIKYQASSPDFQKLLAASERADFLVPSEKVMILAALGKAYEDIGEYDKAFAAIDRFNAAHETVEVYDEAGWTSQTTNMMRIYQKGFFESDVVPGPNTASPIFIFGLPRSGTTLTEQILARHSQTNAVGETEVLSAVYKEWLAKWSVARDGEPPNPFSSEALADAAEMYLARTAQYGTGDGPRFVDKSLSSHRYLGFLHYVFPNARFINCVRDPMDVAVSCYVTLFGPGMPWSYDLRNIGRFFRRHQKLILHWQAQLPHPIHTQVYEDMVNEPEAQARALLNFCDLPWEDAVLDTTGIQRPIHTASVVQARQPIYKTSVGRAERFEKYLAPLKATLGKSANPDWYKS